MTNPTPRPALRKAADADIHPAAPKPARAPRTPRPSPTPAGTSSGSRAAASASAGTAASPVAGRAPSGAGSSASGRASAKPVPTSSAAETPAAAPSKSAAKPATKRAPDAAAAPRPRKRKFGGSTSDHMRVPEAPGGTGDTGGTARRSAAARPGRKPGNALDALFPQGGMPTRRTPLPTDDATGVTVPAASPADADVTVAAVGTTSSPEPGPETKGSGAGTSQSSSATMRPELMAGKTVELEVHVPKALRKAARTEAKKRGLDLDAVVADLLHHWLTTP